MADDDLSPFNLNEINLANYDLGEELGTGGYGKVFYLNQKRHSKSTKIGKFIDKNKVVKWHPPGKADAMPLEVHICMNTAHRNIAKAIDYVNIDRNWFLMIMNNHSGTDLFDFIEHKEIIPEVTCHRIFTQLTDAVKYLAGKKIIHRDIKDENILINDRHDVQLIDFGSAIQYYGNADDAISPKFVGTMKYCPPEAITQGKFRALGGDIWAMGILLYTLFHGGNPFYDANEILNARLEIDEHVSPYACDLMIGLLNKDHRKRYDLKEICSHHWVQHGSEAPILEQPKSNGTA